MTSMQPKSYRQLIYVSMGILILLVFSIWMVRKMPVSTKQVRFGGIEGFEDSEKEKTPQGIPAYQIPAGDESLYILKSQIVPPVCPRCPSAVPTKAVPPPCPACERCPEPSFDCKKVPNYQSGGNLPTPILNDFSTFGM